MRFHLPGYSRAVARTAERCLDRPARTLAAFGAVLVATLIGLSSATIDPSPEAFIVQDGAWETYAEIDHTFGIGETVVLGLYERGGSVFDAETVQTIAELDRRIQDVPTVARVLSIASASVMAAPRDDETIDVGTLLPEGSVTDDKAKKLGQRISNHPIYAKALTDDRHEKTFVLVQLDSEISTPAERLEAVQQIRSIADEFRSKSRTVHMAGLAVTKEAIASGAIEDVLFFLPCAFVLLALLLWLMFGELVASLIPLVSVAFSAALVVATQSLFGIPLNMATFMVPTIIMVVGLADSVHFLAELRRQWQRSNDRKAALVATVEVIALPCLLTSATSAAGFGALVLSRLGPIREMGAYTAIGLIVAYLLSMFLTPTLLFALGYPRASTDPFVAAPRMGRSLTRMAVWASRSLLVPFAVVGFVSGACFAAFGHLEVNFDFVDYLDQNHRLRQDIHVIQSSLGGIEPIEVILDSGKPDGFLDPQKLQIADELTRSLKELQAVPGAFGFVDFLKYANDLVSGGRGDTGVVPSSPEAVSQILLLDPEDFATMISADRQKIRVTVGVPEQQSESILALVERIRLTAENRLAGTGITPTVTGLPSVFATIIRHLIEDSSTGFLFAALLIWLAMALGLKSPTLATVAMIPNVMPVVLTFATMVLLGFPFDINSTFVACLGIGIAVDDTIHIVARYNRAKAHGSPTPEAAVQYALIHAGHPILLTSILMIAGFSVLCLSSFTPSFRVGLLSCLLIVYAVVFDLLFLPILLLTVDRLGAPEGEARGTLSRYLRDLTPSLSDTPSNRSP